MKRNLWVVCYDIVDNRRRHRVMKAIESYGERVQYSVFECELTNERLRKLATILNSLINPDEDNVRFYPLNQVEREKILYVGTAKPRTVARAIYVNDETVYPF